MANTPNPDQREPSLWCCHEHKMIGDEADAARHAGANGCKVVELDQETSDAVRAEWRKELTQWDTAIAATALMRARDVPEALSSPVNPGSPFGV